MDGVSPFTQPESTREALSHHVLWITAATWLVYWCITVTRAFAIGFPTSPIDLVIRLVACAFGALLCLLIFKLLQPRRLSAPVRFLAAFGLSVPAAGLTGVVYEMLFLVFTRKFEMGAYVDQNNNPLVCHKFQQPCEPFLGEAILTSTVIFWIFAAWCALYVGATIAAELRDRDRQLHIAERTAKDAQLSALRFQLNPHFLFNTLNTLSGLIALDRKGQAEDMVINLSSFLRFSLDSGDEQLVTLAKEIEAQKMYLDIEQVRFSDRLTVHYEVEEQCERALIPPFLLQPLVENAIKHAVAPSDGPVSLTIASCLQGENLVIEVKNSKSHGISRPRSQSLGIGMNNVRKRLTALYGDRAKIQAGPATDGGWVNVIHLPWTERLEDNASSDSG